MQEGREDERDLKEQQRQTEGRSPRKKGGGANRKRYQESVMSFVPVAPGKNQSYVPPKLQTLSGRTEQGRAGQGSSLACICSTKTFLRVNGWQREGQETYHPQWFDKKIKKIKTSGFSHYVNTLAALFLPSHIFICIISLANFWCTPYLTSSPYSLFICLHCI